MQSGSEYDDLFHAATIQADGHVLLAGSSAGTWVETELPADTDMAAVLLDTGETATPTLAPISSSSTSSAQVGIIIGSVVGVAVFLFIVYALLNVYRRVQVATQEGVIADSAPPQVSYNDGVSSTAVADHDSSRRYPVSLPGAKIAQIPWAGDAP